MAQISIIIPALNEAAGIGATLGALQPLRSRGHDVIVVDGGSEDGTPELARPLADRVIAAPRGRASQMNAGAAEARGDVVLFLHADTVLPADADRMVLEGLATTRLLWGRFDVRIAGRHPLLPVVAWLMNFRSRMTGVATGDQAIFAWREAFLRAGGFPPLPLMEDVALARALGGLSRPLCLAERVTTSGRRWESRGVLRTIALMWWLRLRYLLGASPDRLAQRYDAPR
ncbi:MAG TPA: TIGR04283 family arsenosugar biosynthesis glycosyltransferase [Burkholderiales bacterium]|nr:TIGR04283 family arsenosugar biosynthesis glycosyltransferase [Burkholderiales bacterium]